MGARKQAKIESLINTMLDEALSLLSHAAALGDHGREEEAAAEMLRAANTEEQIAYLLDVVGREAEAADHRMRAATYYGYLGEFAKATTLLRAALSVPLPEQHRQIVKKALAKCLAQAKRPT